MTEIIEELSIYNSPANIPEGVIRNPPILWTTIADVLSDALLASYLMALDHVASEVKSAKTAEFADTVRLGVSVAPQEAVEYFKKKNLVTRKEFDLLAEDARAAAFTVAGVYRDDILQGFKNEITDALENGTSQQDVIKRFRSILDGAGHKQLGAFHLETVFRTNMQMSYGVGRRRALEAVTEDLPLWRYNAVMDDRVRPTHAALNRIILPANHPFWDDHFPPWAFNCRCSITALATIPRGYDPSNPSGDAKLFFDRQGMPSKAEVGTTVYDLFADGKFQGVPPQGKLRQVIESGVERAKQNRVANKEDSEFAPLGTPVSRALNIIGTNRFKEQMGEAFRLIDRVHGDGELPQIPVKVNARRNALGSFRYRAGEAVDIQISRFGDHAEFTALHEVGHFLDQQGLPGKGRFSSIHSDDLAEFRKAAVESKAIKQLTESLGKRQGKIVVENVEREYTLPLKYIRYLLKTEEVWARAYSQYVAKKSGDAVAIEQLDKLRRAPFSQLLPSQWEDADFEPIAVAIENLFRKLGWMK